MVNFKHEIEPDENNPYHAICMRCSRDWMLLYVVFDEVNGKYLYNEVHNKFVNEYFTCISDEEVVIKRLLE